jgi:uncharacterized protein (DUF1778 family)
MNSRQNQQDRKIVSFRATLAEKAAIEKQAELSKLTKQDYLLEVALRGLIGERREHNWQDVITSQQQTIASLEATIASQQETIQALSELLNPEHTFSSSISSSSEPGA